MRNFSKFCGIIVLALTICTSNVFAKGTEGKVNINTSIESQLALLPGVGPKLAAEIIGYRMSNGNFKTLDDIKKVSGIGDKKFEKMRDFITMDEDSTIKAIKIATERKKIKPETLK